MKSVSAAVSSFPFGLFLWASLGAQEPAKPAPAAPAKDPALVQIADEPGLPRVLLIGDSISMGYTLPVRARLQGRANVHHPSENCGDTGRGLRRLDAWLGDGKWDVIHFNFGLHDLKYLDAQGNYVPPERGSQVSPLPKYEANLRALVDRLKKTGAKLIFATTTPVPGGTLGRVEHDELGYNETAVRVMKESGIPIDDLHAFVVPRQQDLQRPQNVHFTDAGYAQLGDVVTAQIEAVLPRVRP
ncbi:MAG TPA: SGNH/GDSL hydrolase family protein [Opitutaceae bacterium]